MDFTNLTPEETLLVQKAISTREKFYGYVPEKGLEFIIKNFVHLSKTGLLEENWITAYLNASHFCGIDYRKLQSIFDHCDISRLKDLYPLPLWLQNNSGRISLFRGCMGTAFQPGFSWTTSLDKAIWYAAQHKEYEHYPVSNTLECSVFATTVSVDEIYCYLDHNEPELIISAKKAWKIDVPQEEFSLNRKR